MRGKFFALLLLSALSAWADIRLTDPGQPVVIGGKGIVFTVPAYDADAIAYFLRAGVTDATAKQQISDFVKGVKALGLWANMVCWPMRSTQNAGTGTTVYSLGGLGTHDGTMVNGPTWGADGIVQGAAGQRITTGFNLTLTMSFFGVIKRASADGWLYLGQRTNISSNNPINLSLHQPTTQARFTYYNPAAGTVSAASGSTADVFQAHGFAWTPSVVSIWRDATQLINNSSIPSGPMVVGDQQNAIILGNSFSGTSDSRGTFPFACLVDSTVSHSIYSQIYVLYKSTLGAGLSLP